MKRNLLCVVAILFCLALSSGNLFAEIKLPSIFCDNMVLQQQTEVAIWGKAAKNATVSVTTSWNHKSYSTSALKDGSWKLKVTTPKAGGPYELTLSDGKNLKLKNVLIGEVWICFRTIKHGDARERVQEPNRYWDQLMQLHFPPIQISVYSQ